MKNSVTLSHTIFDFQVILVIRGSYEIKKICTG